MMNRRKIKIEVVSDVVCPWCYIGKRRLEKAMETLKTTYDFDVSYLPFELNPSIPAEGLDQKQYLTDKFGGEDRYLQITSHVRKIAAEEGLQFHFDKQLTSPNTRNAHRIIQFAGKEGKQAEVKEAFMSAYFEKGIDLSIAENLITTAVEAGIEREKIENLLSSDEGLKEVEQMETELQKLGVTGVPFYIIENKYGISGAQPANVFIEAFENIGTEFVNG